MKEAAVINSRAVKSNVCPSVILFRKYLFSTLDLLGENLGDLLFMCKNYLYCSF